MASGRRGRVPVRTVQEAVHVAAHLLHPQADAVPPRVGPRSTAAGRSAAAALVGRPPPPSAGSSATAASSPAVAAAAAAGHYQIDGSISKAVYRFCDMMKTVCEA